MLRAVRVVTLRWWSFVLQGTHWQCPERFWVLFLVDWGQEGPSCCKYPVESGQGCCSTSYNAQDTPPQQRISQPKMSTVWGSRNPGSEAQWCPQNNTSPNSTSHLSVVISRKQKEPVPRVIMVDQRRGRVGQ